MPYSPLLEMKVKEDWTHSYHSLLQRHVLATRRYLIITVLSYETLILHSFVLSQTLSVILKEITFPARISDQPKNEHMNLWDDKVCRVIRHFSRFLQTTPMKNLQSYWLSYCKLSTIGRFLVSPVSQCKILKYC